MGEEVKERGKIKKHKIQPLALALSHKGRGELHVVKLILLKTGLFENNSINSDKKRNIDLISVFLAKKDNKIL